METIRQKELKRLNPQARSFSFFNVIIIVIIVTVVIVIVITIVIVVVTIIFIIIVIVIDIEFACPVPPKVLTAIFSVPQRLRLYPERASGKASPRFCIDQGSERSEQLILYEKKVKRGKAVLRRSTLS